MKKNKTEQKNRKKRLSIGNYFAIIFLVCALLATSGGAYIIYYIVSNTNTQHLISKMKSVEPTTFLDQNGEEFGELGMESRENITYEQVPQVVIDAFLAIEDSRFYKHNGFDLPRFISSAITNLKSGYFAQGGSTLTMQTVDNFILKPEEEQMDKEGIQLTSAQKIERKMKEIYMSMYVEKHLSKEEIMERYLNQINFGDKARGIQRGAQYFFGKNVEQLNLSEAAFLAGCINAPYTNNPYNGYSHYYGQPEGTKFNFYEAATNRRNDTLRMMLYHGFITEQEYELAKSCKLAFQLAGRKDPTNSPYKHYQQAVSKEVFELTGLDPATTPMVIHTYLDKNAQLIANDIADGKVVDLNTNKNYQIASTVLDNATGGIVAMIPGRSDYVSDYYRNRADTVERMCGSTIKPLLDYAFALDHLGYATSRVYRDKKIKVDGTVIVNSDGKYYGKVPMERAIAQSLNVPAILTIQDSIKRGFQPKMVQFMLDLGFDEKEMENFNIRYGLGGSFSTSPKQMAGAFATLANGGVHKEPHYVKKIEFKDGSKEPIIVKPKETRAMSEQAAYMMNDLLYKVCKGQYSGWNLIGMLDWGNLPIHGKTGTSDWWTDGLHLGIPETAMKDEWMINYTNEYTVSTWSGFDQEVADGNNYVTNQLLFENIPGKINRHFFQKLSKNPTRFTRPSGIADYKGGMIKAEFLADAAKNNPVTIMDKNDPIDKLQELFEKLKDKKGDTYTPESFNVLTQVLNETKKLLEDENDPRDEEIKAMLEKLTKAESDLVAKVNKEELRAIINKAASIDHKKYTLESYNHLASVVQSATEVYHKQQPTQEEIRTHIQNVTNAINQLVEEED